MAKKSLRDVLVVGELNMDIILDGLPNIPKIGQEVISSKMNITLGSSSAIFASNLSSLGANVLFAGKIGVDSFGEKVKSDLDKRGVDITGIVEDKNQQTGASYIMNFGMDRAMVTYPGAMLDFGFEDISENDMKSVKHLHISSIFLQPKLKRDLPKILESAKKFGLTTSLDPQWDPSENWDLNLKEILPLVDVFLPNHKEFKFLTGSDDILTSFKNLDCKTNIIAIKDGENGAWLWQNGNLINKKSYLNTNVADCIGAGDSFDAGFIYKFINGQATETCLDFGNICGAINTTCSGGVAAFDSMDKIKKIALENFNYLIE